MRYGMNKIRMISVSFVSLTFINIEEVKRCQPDAWEGLGKGVPFFESQYLLGSFYL